MVQGAHNSSREDPTYTQVAALQEMALIVDVKASSNGRSANTNSSSSGSNAAAPAGHACSEDGSDCGGGSSPGSSNTMLDLDPPFRPLLDRYIALLPPKPSGTGKLLLASSRWGDVVVVDATACVGLNSSR